MSDHNQLVDRMYYARMLRVTSLMRRLAEKLGDATAAKFAEDMDIDTLCRFKVAAGGEQTSLEALQLDYDLPALSEFEEKFLEAIGRADEEGEEWKRGNANEP